ncbi:MAG: sulfur oxidation c-type cytochrome SoxA [bacterium]|jgi:sulfur-oxidizing protein SoxA
MKKLIILACTALLAGCVTQKAAPDAAQPSPEQDRQSFVGYFQQRFPDVQLADYADGAYALPVNAAAREEWQTIEEFPPYELAIGEGESLWNTPFKNGKTYQDCFPYKLEDGIKQHYPQWSEERKMVLTLELALNECREANGEKPLGWKKGKIASLSAYVGYMSRGKVQNMPAPNSSGALAAYAAGRQHYYAKRGQLNMSCADCHVYNSGMRVRSEVLSPSLGHTTHFPVYRSKWGEMGTLHRRFGGCNEQVRAKAFKPQGAEYRNLEYFLAYMNNGMAINSPGARK